MTRRQNDRGGERDGDLDLFASYTGVATFNGVPGVPIELAEKIKKGQFKTGKFGGCRATMSEMWSAVLAV